MDLSREQVRRTVWGWCIGDLTGSIRKVVHLETLGGDVSQAEGTNKVSVPQDVAFASTCRIGRRGALMVDPDAFMQDRGTGFRDFALPAKGRIGPGLEVRSPSLFQSTAVSGSRKLVGYFPMRWSAKAMIRISRGSSSRRLSTLNKTAAPDSSRSGRNRGRGTPDGGRPAARSQPSAAGTGSTKRTSVPRLTAASRAARWSRCHAARCGS